MGTKGVLLAPYYANQFTDFLTQEKTLDTEVNIVRFSKRYKSLLDKKHCKDATNRHDWRQELIPASEFIISSELCISNLTIKNMYPPELTAPMKAQLVQAGFDSLENVAAVDSAPKYK